MKQLPSELWDEILVLLHQQDRVQCMLVCQQWNETIKRSHLFHTIRLSTLNGLCKFKALLKEDPKKGEQVECLVLHYHVEQNVILDSLMPLIPNVRQLLLDSFDFHFLSDTVEFPFRNTIHYFREPHESTVAKPLLSTGLCPLLTTLCCYSWDREVLPFLKNAPVLENLDIGIGIGTISLDIFETIHDNAPNLKSLKIASLGMDGSDIEMNQVAPAPLLQHFQLDHEECTLLNAEYDVVAYLDRKYPNLTHLSYINYVEDANEEEMDDLFNIAWVPYLRKMAPQLDKLHLRGDGYIARFFINNANDMYHISNQCFSINDQDEVNEVKQLTFLSKLKLSVRVLTDYSWLSCLSLLTELEIECENYHKVGSLKLNDITNHCPPTLKRLKLVNTKYPFLMLDLVSVNVESLILERCHLPKGIDIFISQVFPRLDSLVISGGDMERKHFSLLNANLSHIQLELPFPSDTDDVHVVTRTNTQQRRYRPTHAHSNDNACIDLDVYPALKSQPAHQVRNLPYFTLICNSLKNIRVLKNSWS